jgi:uncharacterized protein
MFAQAHQERSIPGAVATAGVDVRREFLKKTYGHLFGAIVAFIALEAALLSQASPLFDAITVPILQALAGSQYSWLIVLALFMAAGWLAQRWAMSDTSRGIQYLGLGLYIVAEAIIFIPLLYVATNVSNYEGVVPVAGVSTLLLFAGLTATVFLTKKDFSFLGPALGIGMMVAFGLIICSILFGFHLGMVFTIAMIALAAGYTLYYTSQVLAHYRPTQHVAASLALFSAIALMFWYVLRLFMSLRD